MFVLRRLLCQLLATMTVVASENPGPSLIALQDSDSNSLIRISLEGRVVKTIAEGVPGIALIYDHNGDFIVLSKQSITRVLKAGVKSVIVESQPGANWCAIAAAQGGDFIVADCKTNILSKVSPSGEVGEFARYPNGSWPVESLGLVETQDGFLLFRQGDDEALQLYRVNNKGDVRVLALSGMSRGPGRGSWHLQDSAHALNGGPLCSDGHGGYYFADTPYTRAVYHMTAAGAVTRLLSLREFGSGTYPLVFEPKSRTLFSMGSFRLISILPTDPGNVPHATAKQIQVPRPTALLLER